MSKISIAVSSCLLGEAVRYDGTDKCIESIQQQLGGEYNLISLCPEMGAGMGVPRPPIHIVDIDGALRLQQVDNAAIDVTDKILHYAGLVADQYRDICGYILKKNSPSCGIEKVKVFNSEGRYDLAGQGMFINQLLQRLPGLPVIDEDDFLIKERRASFLSDVNYYSEK